MALSIAVLALILSVLAFGSQWLDKRAEKKQKPVSYWHPHYGRSIK